MFSGALSDAERRNSKHLISPLCHVIDKVWWSTEYSALMRYDPEAYQPTATTCEEHLHTDEAADTMAEVDAFLAGGETALRRPEHFVRGDGSDFFWHHPIQGGYCVIVGNCTGDGAPGAFMIRSM